MDCGGGELQLPPGFRFHPTDQELVMYYLCRKCGGLPLAAPVIAEVDLYKFDPWQLPEKTRGGEKEWYFFSPRDRKYPNGSRPNRAAGTGYWKATGADKPVTPAGAAKAVAIKKALVFYAGRPPKGVKTNWIMHEYRLADVDRSARKKNTTLRLDEWVLCRIYNKKGVIERHATVDDAGKQAAPATKNPPPRPGTAQAWPKAEPGNPPVEMLCFDRWSGDSVPPLHTDSSSSEHVLSPSADMAWDREAESQPSWGGAWDNDWFNVDDSMLLAPPLSPPPVFRDAGAFWDMFAYLQKPF